MKLRKQLFWMSLVVMTVIIMVLVLFTESIHASTGSWVLIDACALLFSAVTTLVYEIACSTRGRNGLLRDRVAIFFFSGALVYWPIGIYLEEFGMTTVYFYIYGLCFYVMGVGILLVASDSIRKEPQESRDRGFRRLRTIWGIQSFFTALLWVTVLFNILVLTGGEGLMVGYRLSLPILYSVVCGISAATAGAYLTLTRFEKWSPLAWCVVFVFVSTFYYRPMVADTWGGASALLVMALSSLCSVLIFLGLRKSKVESAEVVDKSG